MSIIGKGFKKLSSLFISRNSLMKETEVESFVKGEEDNSRKTIRRDAEIKAQEKVIISEKKDEVAKELPWEYPPPSLLNKVVCEVQKENLELVKYNIPRLEKVLIDFGIEGSVVGTKVGTSITQYELKIKSGTRLNKILAIHREIAFSMAVKEARIIAPIPGKNTIGVEIPNPKIAMVSVREVLQFAAEEDEMFEKKLLVVLGKDIEGNCKTIEIDKMPHLLVSGSTGSGKSMFIHSLLASILMRAKPDEVKLALFDLKRIELAAYKRVPHLICPVVMDLKSAKAQLRKIVIEMEKRYDLLELTGTKNVENYNETIRSNISKKGHAQKMPYLLIIIDELFLLTQDGDNEISESLMILAQMARVVGIHLIVATQRPSADVINGIVKINIPSRISFAVSSGADSRTILGVDGAEKLLGEGDMLYLPQETNTPIRIQGTFISEEETKSIVDFVCKQQKANYDDRLFQTLEWSEAICGLGQRSDAMEEPLYNEIVDFVVEQGKASTSLLQRRFRLGYNRAARCIDLLEERGIVGPQNGAKPREVLVKYSDDE